MRRTVFSIGSTALSGFSNIFVQLAVAALADARSFGRFALVAATIILVVGGARAAIGQTDLLRGKPGADPGPPTAAYTVAGYVLVAGLLAWTIDSAIQPDLTPISLGLLLAPLFVLQDAVRFRAFRQRRPGVAFISDLLLTAIALIAIVGIRDVQDVGTAAALSWAAATLVAFVPAAVLLRFWPSRDGRGWLRQHRDLVRPIVAEFSIQSSLPYAVNWVIALVAGYGALGGYRLVQLVFAGLINIASGVAASAIPNVVDVNRGHYARAAMRKMALVVLTLGLVLTVALALLPEAYGTAAFGDTWVFAVAFIAPAALHGVVNALAVMNHATLRLTGNATFSLKVRIWSSPITLLLVAVGAYWLSGIGAAWALAVGALGAYTVRAVRVRSALRQWERRDE